MTRLAAAAAVVLAACSGAPAPGPGDSGPADAGPKDAGQLDAGALDAGAIDAGTCAGPFEHRAIDLAGCEGQGPGTEDCHARLVVDPARCCAAHPCDRLVVYWSGGEQSCATGTYDPLLERYADAGFVAVCAQPFTTADEAGRYPYAAELERMDRLTARARVEAGVAWTGKKLLHAGVSHGGTAPLVVIAKGRLLETRPTTWRGSERTALVAFDGISNPRTLEEWTGAQASGSGCAAFHSRFVGRYGDGSPLTHSCSNGACFCSAPPHASAWAQDVVDLAATSPASPYACADFTADAGSTLLRFVSCEGQGAPACGATGGDIIPTEQQRGAYDGLKSCPGVVASYAVHPLCAHVACGAWDACGGAEAVAWLASQGF